MIYNFNGIELNTDNCPPNVRDGLMTRQLNHIAGNEVDSKVSGWLKKNPTATEEDKVAYITEVSEGYVARMLSGEWGSGTRGPRAMSANRLDVLIEAGLIRKTKESVASLIAANLTTLIDGEDEVYENVNGERRTFDDYKAKVAASHRMAAIVEAAKKQYDAELAKKAAKAPKGADVSDLA